MTKNKRPETAEGVIIVSPRDGQNRRRTKCFYYRPCDKYCAKRVSICVGSAQCPYYEEKKKYNDSF